MKLMIIITSHIFFIGSFDVIKVNKQRNNFNAQIKIKKEGSNFNRFAKYFCEMHNITFTRFPNGPPMDSCSKPAKNNPFEKKQR